MQTHRQYFRHALLLFLSCMFVFATAIGMSGCGSPTDPGDTTDSGDTADATPSNIADPADIVITAVDLDELLSTGLPVVLNFGDDSQDAQDMLDVFTSLYGDLHEHVLIRSVDLAQNPQAREGFPVQVMPTQFFYQADGTPIPLPMSIGVICSVFMSIETEEPLFTAHEGPLSFEELVRMLEFMGVVSLEVLS